MLTKRHLRWRHLLFLLGPVGLVGCAASQELERVYCYRTLADVSCYLEPDKDHDRQLVSTYLRDPQSKMQADQTADDPNEPEGWFFGLVYAPADLAGRVLSPVGSIVGLFR